MSCVSEDAIAAIASGSCCESERQTVIRHCENCSHCQQLLAESLRVQTPRASEPLCATACHASSELLLRGMSVGKYIIVGLIGIGGMGVVYSARDPELDRLVALKLIRPSQDIRRASKLLHREAQAMARLNHPHVLTVYEVGSFHDYVFIAMELVDGQTVSQWACQQRRSASEIIDVYYQAGLGLAAAHRAGILHRDVKPENILISRNREVFISDFGLAQSSSRQATESLWGTALDAEIPDHVTSLSRSGLVGTPGYVSPEVMSGQPASAASDQYGFCVSLFATLFGHLPSASISKGIAARSTHSTRSVPRYVRQILSKGLDLDSSKRFGSMDELLLALESGRRRRGLAQTILLGACIALLIMAVGIGQYTKQRQSLRCEGAADRLSGGWNPVAHAELVRQVEVAALPVARNAIGQQLIAFGNYAQTIRSVYVAACTSAEQNQVSTSDQVLSDLNCLELRLSIVREFTSQLLKGGSYPSEPFLQAIRDLPSLEDCRHADSSRLESPTSRRDPQRDVEPALNREIADAYRLLAAGEYGSAQAAAEHAANAARSAGARQSWNEAQWLYGVLCERQQMFAKAELAFHQLLMSSLEHRQDRTAVMALTALARSVGQGLHRLEEGRRFAEYGQAILQRIGSPRILGIELDLVRGTLLQMSGEHRAALVLHKRALAALQSEYGAEDTALLAAMGQIASDHRALAEFAEVQQWFQRAHRIAQRAFGDLHPETIRLLIETGVAASRLNRYDEGLGHCQRAAQLFGQLEHGSEFLEAQMLSCRAEAEINLGNCPGAEADIRHLLALDEKRVGHQSKEVTSDLAGLGSVLGVCHGASAESVSALEESLRLATLLSFPKRHIAHIQLELASALPSKGATKQKKADLAMAVYTTLTKDVEQERVDKDLVDKAIEILQQNESKPTNLLPHTEVLRQ